MYTFLKSLFKIIIPYRLVVNNEIFFRRLASIPYKGKNVQCNICKIGLRKFATHGNSEKICPNCGSRSRTRRLYNHIIENNLLTGNVLHFSPPKCLYNKFKKEESIVYYPSDYENEFTADYNFDITKINLPDGSMDLIICYHILEHVQNDYIAISELKRVLNDKGILLLQTPFKSGNIYEDETIITPDERKIAFGQADHVRIYSKNGLKERLKQQGLRVQILEFIKEFQDNHSGLHPESVLIVSK